YSITDGPSYPLQRSNVRQIRRTPAAVDRPARGSRGGNSIYRARFRDQIGGVTVNLEDVERAHYESRNQGKNGRLKALHDDLCTLDRVWRDRERIDDKQHRRENRADREHPFKGERGNTRGCKSGRGQCLARHENLRD